MSNLLRTLTVAGVLAAPLAATAAAPAKAAVPTVSDVLKASGIAASGYVDVGYNLNDRSFNAGAFSYAGANDQSFTLNQVGVQFSSTPSEGFGGVLDILGGRDAGFIPSDSASDIVFKQAYAQYAAGAMTLMGGRFATLAGSEVIASTGNTNATRSLLFAYQPLTHTGVRAAFKLSDALTLTAGANNSYFGSVMDTNAPKTGEVQLAVAAGPATVAVTAYKGTESTNVSPLLVDLVGGFTAGKFSFGLNVDHFDGDTATNTKTDGAALYANLQAGETLRLGARVESVRTKDDVAATRKQAEATLTAALAAAPNFDFVTDLRWDKDNTNPFTTEDTMVTLAVKGIYKF